VEITTINALLELCADLNEGSNHSCTFGVEVLAPSESLQAAVARHFESVYDFRTRRTHPAENWHIEIRPLQGEPVQVLSLALHAWVFETEFSPRLGDDRTWVGRNITENLARKLLAELGGDVLVHEVLTSPPAWYEAHWRDLTISGANGRVLLHLGVTD
jgi:hypothetical protein